MIKQASSSTLGKALKKPEKSYKIHKTRKTWKGGTPWHMTSCSPTSHFGWWVSPPLSAQRRSCDSCNGCNLFLTEVSSFSPMFCFPQDRLVCLVNIFFFGGVNVFPFEGDIFRFFRWNSVVFFVSKKKKNLWSKSENWGFSKNVTPCVC